MGLAEFGSPTANQPKKHFSSSSAFHSTPHRLSFIHSFSEADMPATLTDTALFASIIIFAIVFLILLFVVAFNYSRPGIYLEDDHSSEPAYYASSTTIQMDQVDAPLSKPLSQSILLY